MAKLRRFPDWLKETKKPHFTDMYPEEKDDPTVDVVVFTASGYPSYLFFRWNPMLCTALAAIPVTRFLNRLYKMPPVVSTIVGFAVFSLLSLIAWFAAEVIVILTMVAVLNDFRILRSKVLHNIQGKGYRIPKKASPEPKGLSSEESTRFENAVGGILDE